MSRVHPSRVHPRMRTLAERLLTQDGSAAKSPITTHPADFPVLDKLRPRLTTLMGGAGVHALLMRARVLAGEEVPWLQNIRIKADGSLEGLDEAGVQDDRKNILEGKTALLAQVLGLLVAFIGEILTLQLMREVWPKLSLEGLDSGRGDHSEKQE